MNFDMEDDTQWSDLCNEKWDKWTADKLREKWATLKKEVGESATHRGEYTPFCGRDTSLTIPQVLATMSS